MRGHLQSRHRMVGTLAAFAMVAAACQSTAAPSAGAVVGHNEAVSGEILGKAWIPNLKPPGCKVLIINPFPTAFVLTLRADGMKRAVDAAGFTHEDLAGSGDAKQSLGLISANLQNNPA